MIRRRLDLRPWDEWIVDVVPPFITGLLVGWATMVWWLSA